MGFMRDFLHYGLAAAAVAAVTVGAHAVTETASAPSCQTVELSLYFSPGETDLNPFAEKLVSAAAAKLNGCEIARIEARGYADASGAPTTNKVLSEARAQMVVDALEKKGVTSERINVTGVGEFGAVDANGKAVPMRRKTDIQIIPVSSIVS